MLNTSIAQTESIFDTVREIPAAEVARQFGVDLQQKGGRWRGLCPFHLEKTPSFFVYKNRFKCFGCGWGGDSVDLVSKLLNLTPLQAAEELARVFNLGVPAPLDGAALRKLKRKRYIEAAFKNWREQTLRGIAIYLRACDRIIAAGPDKPGFQSACFLQPRFEHLFEILSGPIDGQVELYRRGGVI